MHLKVLLRHITEHLALGVLTTIGCAATLNLFSLDEASARVRRGSRDAIIDTFSEAKKVAPSIHAEYPFTIYCGCTYKGKAIDLASCGYRVYKDRKRAARLEWEHVVPAEAFGQAFAEWRVGGPKCKRSGKRSRGRACAETNPEFRRMESDLYNLWPEIGELNNMRKNYSMAEISGPALSFGRCSAKVQNRKFEPMPPARGIVARVYLYMDQKYPGRGIISEKNKPLFASWDAATPVSERECRVGRRVFEIQHNENPVLASRCQGRNGWPKLPKI